MPEPIGEPAYALDEETPLVYGEARSDLGPDDESPGLYLPGGRGWTCRALPPPRRPIGFQHPSPDRRPWRAPLETPPCD